MTSYPAGPGERSRQPAVLLLHEPRRSAERWRAIAPALAAEREVLAPDLPGYAKSRPSAHAREASVEALIALLGRDRGDQPVDVVGTGPSAGLAIMLAAARPDLVRRLVMIAGGWPATVPRKPESSAAADGLPRPERSLVIWGAKDRVLLPRHGERVVSALGRFVDPATVAMVTFPGIGHRVLDDAPADVTALLCEFLHAS